MKLEYTTFRILLTLLSYLTKLNDSKEKSKNPKWLDKCIN